MHIYLFMAVFWAVLGIALLAWHAINPQAPFQLGGEWSAGWLGLVLAVYNAVRWWSGRTEYSNSGLEKRVSRPRKGAETTHEKLNPDFKFEAEADRNDMDAHEPD